MTMIHLRRRRTEEAHLHRTLFLITITGNTQAFCIVDESDIESDEDTK